MNPTSAYQALTEILTCAEVALGKGDTEAAAVAMQSGAELCARLESADLIVTPSEMAALKDRFDRCGVELERLTRELQSDSARGENLRRGVASYEAQR
ncbi:MAG: hypothetical protein ABIS92_07590 [Polyangia bacterium]